MCKKSQAQIRGGIVQEGADGGRHATSPCSDSISSAVPADCVRLNTANRPYPVSFLIDPAHLEEVLRYPHFSLEYVSLLL